MWDVVHLQEFAWGLAGVFTAIVSGGVMLYGGVRFGLVPGYKGLRATIEKYEALAELVQAQLTPNGGSSLLDKIHHIDECLTAGCPLFGHSGVCPRGLPMPEIRM